MGRLWVQDFSYPEAGMCYTLNQTYNWTQNLEAPFTVGLTNTNFWLFLNDPRLLLINYNPLMPITVLLIQKKIMLIRAFLIIQHKNLDLPSKPCHASPSYSFTSCIKEFLSLQIGCRLPWDTWITGTEKLSTFGHFC